MGVMEEILAELRKINARLDHIGGAVNTPAAPAEKPKAAKAKAEAPTAPAPAAPQRLDDQTATQPGTPLTYEQVKSAGLALVAAKGRDAMVAVLAKFNLKSAQEAKPVQYAELMRAIQEATR